MAALDELHARIQEVKAEQERACSDIVVKTAALGEANARLQVVEAERDQARDEIEAKVAALGRLHSRIEEVKAEHERACRETEAKTAALGEASGRLQAVKAERGQACRESEAKAATPKETPTRNPVAEAERDPAGCEAPLEPGGRVRCQLLVAASQLNGVCGTIVEFHPRKGRYAVEFACTDAPKMLKRENLAPASPYPQSRVLLVRQVFKACDTDRDSRLAERELWPLAVYFSSPQDEVVAWPSVDEFRHDLWADEYRALCALCQADPVAGFDVGHFACLMDQYCGDDLLRDLPRRLRPI